MSPLSLNAHRELPSRLTASSHGLTWRSVLARSYADPVETEAFSTVATPDLLVAIVLDGTVTTECQRPRGWTKATLRPGAVGVTSPGTSWSLRWRGATPGLTSLHLHLSAELLLETAEALGSPRLMEDLPDALSLDDPAILSIGRALGAGLERGAESLYADSLAQALAAHLLHGRLLGTRRDPADRTARTRGPDVRPAVDYMRDHLAEEVTLDDLAAVARMSRYQLIQGFTRSSGLTPHRYLMSLRMQRAAELLSTTDYSVRQVSALCGYASPGQCTTAFGRHHQISPARYRRSRKA